MVGIKPMVDVSIVIACYNEEPLLEESVKKIMAVMDASQADRTQTRSWSS